MFDDLDYVKEILRIYILIGLDERNIEMIKEIWREE